MTDHAAALLAFGLTIAFGGGYLTCRLISAYKAMYGAKRAVQLATAAMRAIRLRWLYWAVPVFAVLWLWVHGNL
jgi:hypothetical protein